MARPWAIEARVGGGPPSASPHSVYDHPFSFVAVTYDLQFVASGTTNGGSSIMALLDHLQEQYDAARVVLFDRVTSEYVRAVNIHEPQGTSDA